MAKKEMVIVNPEKIEWKPIEQYVEEMGEHQTKDVPKGVWVKVLSRNEETRAMAVLVKFDKDSHEPKHSHPSDNFFTVIEGNDILLEGNEFKKGMYCFTSAGGEHGPLDVPEGGILFAYFNGPPF